MKSRKNRARSKLPIRIGASVTMATLGCSSCENNGAVDPPPPPFSCDDVGAGQSLVVTEPALSDARVTTTLVSAVGSFSSTPVLSNLERLDVESVDLLDDHRVRLVLRRNPPDVQTGRFTLSGRLQRSNSSCDVVRTFTVTVHGDQVDVALLLDAIPMGRRDRGRIELLESDGLAVRLRAVDAGGQPLAWAVTGGELITDPSGEVRRQLPSTPGIYQVELVTDHGDQGFGFDSLALEVS